MVEQELENTDISFSLELLVLIPHSILVTSKSWAVPHPQKNKQTLDYCLKQIILLFLGWLLFRVGVIHTRVSALVRTSHAALVLLFGPSVGLLLFRILVSIYRPVCWVCSSLLTPATRLNLDFTSKIPGKIVRSASVSLGREQKIVRGGGKKIRKIPLAVWCVFLCVVASCC